MALSLLFTQDSPSVFLVQFIRSAYHDGYYRREGGETMRFVPCAEPIARCSAANDRETAAKGEAFA